MTAGALRNRKGESANETRKLLHLFGRKGKNMKGKALGLPGTDAGKALKVLNEFI